MSVLPAASDRPSVEPVDVDQAERKQLRKSGLPVPADTEAPIGKRILTSGWTWVFVALVIAYVGCLIGLYQMMVPEKQLPNGTVPGLSEGGLKAANRLALITAIPLAIVLMLADRFRTQGFLRRLPVWLFTFGWGAIVACFVSAHLNTWVSQFLSIVGDGDPSTSVRAAIFVAPFVEEATKATILFWVAILIRYRWVSRLGGLVLAGLSGAGFAYVENIIYYARVHDYVVNTAGTGMDPMAAMFELFVIRGGFSFFAHPVFTMMTGLGLVIALRTRSKIVRVVAPLAGFLAAALLHMAWNGFASTVQEPRPLYIFLALPIVIVMIFFILRQYGREKRLLRARLTDYTLLGWLSESDRDVISQALKRFWARWWAFFEGPVVWWKMITMIRLGTELGYLRDAMTRGLVDEAGLIRERQIFHELEELRLEGIGLEPASKVVYPWTRIAHWNRNRKAGNQLPDYAPPGSAVPAGVGGQSATYSQVDPTWAPPGR
ncbi:PrsW family intramembrane metalloprotease [Propionibacteriaceae bacterium Y1685]|uniref:PrsW family intramembrane metalloprotease n=1 Tax=Microlunatus sp. Y1700 TaxID=3418487 RepID=UPI003B79E552